MIDGNCMGSVMHDLPINPRVTKAIIFSRLRNQGVARTLIGGYIKSYFTKSVIMSSRIIPPRATLHTVVQSLEWADFAK